MMSTTTKIVFPIPPPTTNTLNARQRARLMRSAKKLEKVLGATPHLVDDDDDDYFMGPYYIDQDSSSSESEPPSRGASPAPTRSASVCSNMSILSDENWPEKIPLLRVTRSGSASRSSSSVPAPRPDSFLSLSDEPSTPSFNIANLRREKMDRLRRKLGDGVPAELVFPSQPSSPVSDKFEDFDELEIKALPPLPKTRPPRDSIACPTIHKVKRKPVPKLIVTPIESPPPVPSIASIDEKKYRLSLIMESPDEDKKVAEWGIAI